MAAIALNSWKEDHDYLPTNYTVAKARTESTIKRLNKDPKLLRTYGNIIEEQERKGFIEKVDEESGSKIHNIPHHAVRKDSVTTPIRIVYDCSCRQSPNHASLNDCLMSTPPVTTDFTKLMMKFRINKYAVSTDIEKAFLHIQLDEGDRDAVRFFWLSDPRDPNSKLITYHFKAVLFGATYSPFILNATLLKHLEQCKTETASTMKDDLYVDNILTSFASEEEIINFYKEARSLMSNAGFNLRSWASNSKLLNDMADSEHVLDNDQKTKVLGLRWNTATDIICFAASKINTSLKYVTKREIHSQSSSIYYPLGFLDQSL